MNPTTLETLTSTLDRLVAAGTLQPGKLSKRSPLAAAWRRTRNAYFIARAARDQFEADQNAYADQHTALIETDLDAYMALEDAWYIAHDGAAIYAAERAAIDQVLADGAVLISALHPACGQLVRELAARPIARKRVLDLVLKLDPTL